ncbi:hypothetical protein FMM74_020470 [Lachnospiraceae bacterium MD308]|nr:hypothetical protein [Lachnospiraceae bacterium MD308]
MKGKNKTTTIPLKSVNCSKDNPIIEISSKQTQVQINNVVPPVKPKENKKVK